MKVTASARALHKTLKEQGVALRVKGGRLLVKPSGSPIQPGLQEAVKKYEEQIVFLISEETPAHAPLFTCPECGGGKSYRRFHIEICAACHPPLTADEIRRCKAEYAALEEIPDPEGTSDAELRAVAHGPAEEAFAILRRAGVRFSTNRTGKLYWNTMMGAPVDDVAALVRTHESAFLQLHRQEAREQELKRQERVT